MYVNDVETLPINYQLPMHRSIINVSKIEDSQHHQLKYYTE
jgi:hypothetical protein